jgi:NAD(P)H dehydrogenase (quinone)
MQKKKILLLLGHPNPDSYCAALLDAYATEARKAGAEVRIRKVSDMQFDPSLHMGFGKVQELEPDLVAFQEDLHWSEHFVMVFPLWWGSTPAVLKGLIDRTFLPDFTFKYHEGKPFQEKLMTGKSARVLLTMDSPGFWYKWVLGRPLTKTLRGQILGYCGFKPLRISLFGSVKMSSPEKRQAWLKQAAELGRKDA